MAEGEVHDENSHDFPEIGHERPKQRPAELAPFFAELEVIIMHLFEKRANAVNFDGFGVAFAEHVYEAVELHRNIREEACDTLLAPNDEHHAESQNDQ